MYQQPNMYHEPQMINYKKEKRIELLIRWWSVGAIYFFFGFGIISYSHLDDIFLIGIGVWLINTLVVNPICNAMLNIKKKDTRKYNEIPLYEKLLKHLKEFVSAVIIVALVVGTYHVINLSINNIMNYDEETVKLPAEPFLFATFYMTYYLVITKIIAVVIRLYKNKKRSNL